MKRHDLEAVAARMPRHGLAACIAMAIASSVVPLAAARAAVATAVTSASATAAAPPTATGTAATTATLATNAIAATTMTTTLAAATTMNASTTMTAATTATATAATTAAAAMTATSATTTTMAAATIAATTTATPVAGERTARAAPGQARVHGAPKPRVAAASPGTRPDYLARADVIGYIDDLVSREPFDRDALVRVLGAARYSATAARLMTPTSSGGVQRDWSVYRARFVEPVRLAAGYRFWADNEALLVRAEREFGVPAEIIVGILGVETVYGRNTGGFRVIDALTTLAFDYPDRTHDRSSFFRDQLTEALRLMRDGGVDLATLRGSYAGAVGMPQFMPGSIRDYAIDYDGDGRVDLVGSTADIVGSVANFLVRHGWVRDVPTVLPLAADLDPDAVRATRIDAMVAAGSVPTFGLRQFAAVGLTTASAPVEPLALIDLPSGQDASGRPRVAYLAGTQNFHVITRYNRSYFYAYSVIELGSTIKALRDVR